MTPDRIESLLQDLADAARAVPVGTAYHGGGLDGAPVYDVRMVALQLIRAWEEANPAQPTLEDLMLAFAADFPNSYPQLMFYDPKREPGVWMATAHGYNWRTTSKSPAEAIAALRAQIDAVTISELPTLPEGWRWLKDAFVSHKWFAADREKVKSYTSSVENTPKGAMPPAHVELTLADGARAYYRPVQP